MTEKPGSGSGAGAGSVAIEWDAIIGALEWGEGQCRSAGESVQEVQGEQRTTAR